VRWGTRRKERVVPRLLRGESLDALARECRLAARTIVTLAAQVGTTSIGHLI